MKTVVIDANIGLSYAIPLSYSSEAIALINQWRVDKVRIIVPLLWYYEVLSGLRKAIAHRLISQEKALDAINAFQDMAFEEYHPAPGIEVEILEWAERIDQIVAYDAVYLALSEQLDAEFWTADRRLVNAARQAGADWIYPVGVV
ncbi:MAG: type II toxin-antitoxin system VapC family toxin [Anaerolineales bacterium]